MKQNKWELRLRNCPCCNGQSKLEVEIPLFGWQGVRVKCTHCGVNVSTSQISELITRDDGISTPITEESLMKAIRQSGMIQQMQTTGNMSLSRLL